MAELTIQATEIMSEARYPFRTPNPADTVDTIINDLSDIEESIDSPQVNSEVIELSTGGALFGRNSRPCLNIRLRESKTKELQKFGCCIVPQEFGNLVYLVKYEYMSMGFFDLVSGKEEALRKIKKKLNTLDKWMEYTFIQTLGDYVYVEMLRKYDSDFNGNLDAYRTFFTIE
jgi:hypothetical protein